MYKLLLTGVDGQLAEEITQQAAEIYDLRLCTDGGELTEELTAFRPELVLLDVELPFCDTAAAISTATACGGRVIVAASAVNAHISGLLKHSGVLFALIKPLTLQAISDCLRDAQLLLKEDPNTILAERLERRLIRLGLDRNRNGFIYTADGVRYMMQNDGDVSAQSIYAFIAEQWHSTPASVERAMRQSIQQAYNHRNKMVWLQYIPDTGKCPANFRFMKYMMESLKVNNL